MDRSSIKKRLFFWYSILWVLLFAALYIAYRVYFIDRHSTISKWVGLCAGAVAILTSVCKICEISFYRFNSKDILKLSDYFLTGAIAWLKTRYKIIALLSLIIAFFTFKSFGTGFLVCFFGGVLAAVFCDYFFNFVLSKAIAKIPFTIDEAISSTYKLTYNLAGAIALFSVGSLISICTIVLHCYKDPLMIATVAFGFLFCAVFSSISGSISKRACHSAADIISNFEYDILDNDKRNPMLLLNGLSRCVFSPVSHSFDFTCSFIVAIIASMITGAEAYMLHGMFLPIIIAANGIFSALGVILFTKLTKTTNPTRTLFISEFISVIIFLLLSLYCTRYWLQGNYHGIFGSIAVGSIGGFILTFLNLNYLHSKFAPVKNVANSAIAGIPPVFIQNIKESFKSVFLPIIVICFIILFAFLFPDGINAPLFGIWGITLATASMLSTTGIVVAINIFGNICKNSNYILKSFDKELPEIQQQHKLKALTDIGYYISAFCKNFNNVSSVLCTISLLIAFTIIANVEEIDILNPYVLVSLFVGVSIPFMLSSFILGGVSKTAKKLALEVRKQFRRFPQILRFEMRPDFEKCCVISSKNSAIQTVFYGIIICLIIYLDYKILNIEALCGLIFGIILSSTGLNFVSTNSSIVAKSAKKYFKEEFVNAQETDEYKSLNAADAVFSSLRDLIAPCLNIFVKFVIVTLIAILHL